MAASVGAAVSRFCRLDIMVNNAGYIMFSPVVETSADDWRRMMDVNINGVFLGMQAGARQMIAQGSGGSIVNASSGGGRKGVPNFAHYCATKAAIIMMSQAAAGELAAHRIRVNCYAGPCRNADDERPPRCDRRRARDDTRPSLQGA